jgi:hypothetical protein
MNCFHRKKYFNRSSKWFQGGKITETEIHNFLESVQRPHKMIGIFLDLPKAYNVLNHKLVLSKSDACGIRGVINLWFKSYLSNRKQCADVSYEYINTKISGTYISVLKDIKTQCASKSIPWPNFTVIIDKLSFNKYTMGKHSSACLRHRYSNKGCE